MSNKISIETEKSEKFLKSLKCRIYPTEAQKVLIEKSFGCLRLAYNEHLQEKTEFYINNILPVKNTTTKEEKSEIYKTFKASLASELKIKYPFMTEVSDWVIQGGIRQCELAYKNFFNNLKKNRKVGKKKNPYGFPQFKSKKDSHQSFSMQNVDFKKHFDRNSSTVKVPKLGKLKFYKPSFPEWFKIVESFGTVTISRTSSGRYYISILCHLKYEFKFRGKLERKEKLGLDFSPKFLYIDSNNQTGKDFGYIAEKQTNHKKLRKLSRKFNRRKQIQLENSPKKQNSKNREKARIKLSKFEEKVANRRKYFQEVETKRLVTNYSQITIEDLNLKGISRFLTNAKNMVDTSWGSFVTKLEQKGKYYNCQIIKADRYFPSSQICHNCGTQNHSLKLSDRKWICPNCGKEILRDYNAAINLKNYIPTKHREFTSAETENKTTETLAIVALGLGTVEEAETENREISDKKAERL